MKTGEAVDMIALEQAANALDGQLFNHGVDPEELVMEFEAVCRAGP